MRNIYLSSSISSEDRYPRYSFGFYDDNDDRICINFNEEDKLVAARDKLKKNRSRRNERDGYDI